MKLHEFGSFWTVYKQTALKGKRRSEQARWNDGKTVRCSNSHNETKPHKQERKEHWERERVCVCMSVWVCEREQSMVVKAERQCCCRHQHHYQQQQQLSFLSILLNERERERIFYFWSYLVPFTHYQKCKKQNEEKVLTSKQKISSSQKLRAQVTYKNSLLYLYRKFNR